MRLRRSDLESVLAFLAELDEVDHDEPYSPPLLAALRGLIRCDEIVYQEYEYAARRSCFFVGVSCEGASRWGSREADPPRSDDDDALYWRVGPCPIVEYRVRERSLAAVRMSDLVPRPSFRELPVYREFFRPQGLERMLDLGLPQRSARQRSLILFRSEGAPDFSERDRAVLELLRPHFYRLEAQAGLRRRLAEALRAQERGVLERDLRERLTRREREVAEMLSAGKTNAEIAADLWVSPSTVKKHLEHIYAKLGVGRRAAVAAMHAPRN